LLGSLGNPFWRPQRPTNIIPAQTPETSMCPCGASVELIQQCWWSHALSKSGFDLRAPGTASTLCALSAEMPWLNLDVFWGY